MTRVRRSALFAAAVLAAACATRRPPREAAAPPAPDCAALRDDTLRACVEGFRAEVPVVDERSVEFDFAIRGACPYAGAIAWSGCRRGAFERFRGRSALGTCGDEADYVETSILTSCLRRPALPLAAWNALVARCFEWAAAGSARLRAACATAQPAHPPGLRPVPAVCSVGGMAEPLLERGAIAFLYRPRVETFAARGLDDVQRFFVLLAPHAARDEPVVVRRVAVGRKRLPDTGSHERFWAYVDRVAANAADAIADLGPSRYWTKTRGLRHQPGARLAGEGAYALSRHGAHVHLEYRLRVGGAAGEVQHDLRIEPMARYVVATFAESVPAADDEERRFLPLEPEHLARPGAELVLIGARPGLEGDALAGAAAEAQARAAAEAAGFDVLRRRPDGFGALPLFDGVWR